MPAMTRKQVPLHSAAPAHLVARSTSPTGSRRCRSSNGGPRLRLGPSRLKQLPAVGDRQRCIRVRALARLMIAFATTAVSSWPLLWRQGSRKDRSGVAYCVTASRKRRESARRPGYGTAISTTGGSANSNVSPWCQSSRPACILGLR